MNLAVLVLLDAQPVVSLTGLQLILALITLVLGSGGFSALLVPYLSSRTADRTAKLQLKGTLTTAEIESEDKDKARLWEEVEKLRSRVDAKDGKIEELINTISKQASTLAELQGQVDRFKLQMEEKDHRIEALETENTSLRQDIDRLQRAQGAFQTSTAGHFRDIHESDARKTESERSEESVE
jgi:chromosome segregation ATPase